MKYYHILSIGFNSVNTGYVVAPTNIYRWTRSTISYCDNLQLGII